MAGAPSPTLWTGLRRQDVLLAIFAGVLCYYLGALANFYALTIIDASVERPLLFAVSHFCGVDHHCYRP
jgi:hypothetical protein